MHDFLYLTPNPQVSNFLRRLDKKRQAEEEEKQEEEKVPENMRSKDSVFTFRQGTGDFIDISQNHKKPKTLKKNNTLNKFSKPSNVNQPDGFSNIINRKKS